MTPPIIAQINIGDRVRAAASYIHMEGKVIALFDARRGVHCIMENDEGRLFIYPCWAVRLATAAIKEGQDNG